MSAVVSYLIVVFDSRINIVLVENFHLVQVCSCLVKVHEPNVRELAPNQRCWWECSLQLLHDL